MGLILKSCSYYRDGACGKGYHAGTLHEGNCRACIAAGKHLAEGLGDAVAVIAQPIARVIDSVLRTNVQGCGGCKARQAALNKSLPFK